MKKCWNKLVDKLEGKGCKSVPEHYKALSYYLTKSNTWHLFTPIEIDDEYDPWNCKTNKNSKSRLNPSRHPFLENMRYLLKTLGHYSELIKFLDFCLARHWSPYRGYLPRYYFWKSHPKKRLPLHFDMQSRCVKKLQGVAKLPDSIKTIHKQTTIGKARKPIAGHVSLAAKETQTVLSILLNNDLGYGWWSYQDMADKLSQAEIMKLWKKDKLIRRVGYYDSVKKKYKPQSLKEWQFSLSAKGLNILKIVDKAVSLR